MSGDLTLTVTLTPEQIEALAAAVGDRLAARSEPWLRGAKAAAEYLDCPVSRVQALASARRIPCRRDGSALLFRRSELDEWIENGGGIRP